MAAQNEHRHAN